MYGKIINEGSTGHCKSSSQESGVRQEPGVQELQEFRSSGVQELQEFRSSVHQEPENSSVTPELLNSWLLNDS